MVNGSDGQLNRNSVWAKHKKWTLFLRPKHIANSPGSADVLVRSNFFPQQNLNVDYDITADEDVRAPRQ